MLSTHCLPRTLLRPWMMTCSWHWPPLPKSQGGALEYAPGINMWGDVVEQELPLYTLPQVWRSWKQTGNSGTRAEARIWKPSRENCFNLQPNSASKSPPQGWTELSWQDRCSLWATFFSSGHHQRRWKLTDRPNVHHMLIYYLFHPLLPKKAAGFEF